MTWATRDRAEAAEAEIEHCCYCGRHTTSGIYFRDDPDTIADHEDHKRGVTLQ